MWWRQIRSTDQGAVIFLAGGITGCPDWQAEAVSLLTGADVTAMNPRRPGRMADVPDRAAEQVAWEFRYLDQADVVLFWFPASESVQPIARYELGRIAAGPKPIAVGVDPGYVRRLDVVLQLSHARPDVPVHATLAATVGYAAGLASPG
jgi:hypothetical protein